MPKTVAFSSSLAVDTGFHISLLCDQLHRFSVECAVEIKR